jgi:hypothetical protein
LLHRRRDFGVRGLDVAVLSDRHVSVPYDSLDSFVGNSKLVKIRRQAATKSMPAMPLDPIFIDQRDDASAAKASKLMGFPAGLRNISPFAGLPEKRRRLS